MREGWVRKSISEICDKASSNIAQNKIADIGGDYPVYGASGYVQNVDFYHRDTDYIGIVKDGSGVGRVNVYPAYSSLLGTMQYIIPKDGYLLGYVAYALKGLNLSSFASGAAIPHIYFKDYGKCKIDVPPLSEQQRIVSELDLLSSIIEKKKAQLKEYDQLAQSIFYDMFGDPVENPKGWEVKRYRDFAEIIGGYAFNSKSFVDSGVPVLKIGNINTGVLRLEEICYYPYTPSLKRYEVHSGDLVISLTGTTGKDDYGNICIIPSYADTFYLNQRNAILRPNETCNNIFLQYVFKQRTIKKELTKNNHGVRQANILNQDILGLSIPLPPLSLQQSFASKIEAIERQKALIQQSIAEVQMLFDSRMDDWFA